MGHARHRHVLFSRTYQTQKSEVDSRLIETGSGQPHLRLGLNRVKGLGLDGAERVVMARKQRAFIDSRDISQRAALDRGDLQALAAADTLHPLAGDRHGARWSVAGIRRETGLLAAATGIEAIPDLPAATEGQEIVADYASLGLTLRRHPLALLRPRLTRLRLLSASELRQLPDGRLARTTGLVTVRQRPGTAEAPCSLRWKTKPEQSILLSGNQWLKGCVATCWRLHCSPYMGASNATAT